MERIVAWSALLLAAVSVAPTTLFAQARSGLDTVIVPQVVVSAGVERGIPADLAILTLEFAREGPSPQAAGRNLALKTDSLRRALQAIGIPHDSIVTASRWYWWRDRMEVDVRTRIVRETPTTRKQVQDTTYRIHERLTVRIRDLDRIGAVIDAALAQGLTEISQIRFSATDTREATMEATRAATRKARTRAETIAEAGGGRLGRTLTLSTQPFRVEARDYNYIALMPLSGAAAGNGGETVVVAPRMSVAVTVYGRWELLER